jgi:hypothetical protein
MVNFLITKTRQRQLGWPNVVDIEIDIQHL